jgi:hypothetical protein
LKITPALPTPYRPPAAQERPAVSAPHPADPMRDAAQRPARGHSADPVGHQPLVARGDSTLAFREAVSPSRHIDRALASYTWVAEDSERSALRDLLGFDAFA